MDLLKVQLERIQRQLSGLNATQKMLTVALTAIMVITVVWWGKYAGEAEMLPLLSQAFSPADLGRIQEHLDGKGIHYTVAGDKLLVPADRRIEILSELSYSRLMPHNTSEGFDAIIKQSSPFDPEEKQAKIWNHGKELLLSQIIGSFPDVVQADVLIDPTSVMRIEGSIEPSAVVNITLRDGAKPSQHLVDAAAEAVAGAQSGIVPGRIRIVVNGLAQKVRDSDGPVDATEQLALIQQNEVSVEQRVRQTYSDIPGLLVSVTLKLNTTTTQTEKHDFDSKGAVQKQTETTSETDQTSGGGGGGGEAGAVPNQGMSANPAGASSGQSQTHEKTDDKFQNYVPETHVVSRTPAGDATPVGATVRVPLSYFARLLIARDPTIKSPTYAQLQPVIADELPRLREGVARCVMLAATTDVSIDTYVDTAPSLALQPALASTSSGVSSIVNGHARELALGALAVMSLFMASMMVRKASPSPLPIAPVPVQVDNTASLHGKEPLVGEALGGDAMLDAMELNEDAVKTTQMVDQVSTMVRDNPDAAAALMKRWLNRT
jgi:flagellar biosynthesis/type III secretory pathway M-ring protein FliF/YscJ